MTEALETQAAPAALPEAEALAALKLNVNDDTRTAILKARDVQSYLESYNRTTKDIAVGVGKSQSWLDQLLRFLNLPKEIIERAEREGVGFRKMQDIYSEYRGTSPATNETTAAIGSATDATNDATAATEVLRSTKSERSDATSRKNETNKEFHPIAGNGSGLDRGSLLIA
jgi:hypothetical protein